MNQFNILSSHQDVGGKWLVQNNQIAEKHHCGCCKENYNKTAMSVNNINLCFSCVDFFNRTCTFNDRTAIEEIKHQTNYIKNNA